MEESLDRSEETVTRLTSDVDRTESEREDLERRLRSLENSEATISGNYEDQVKINTYQKKFAILKSSYSDISVGN